MGAGGAAADARDRLSEAAGGGPSALVGTLLLLALVLPLYLLTAVRPTEINVDAEAAAVPAWHLAQHGTVDLDAVDARGNPWIAEGAHGRVVSDRPPGLWLVAVPAYLLAGGSSYAPGPATVTAVLLALGAVCVLHLVLRRCVPAWWALGSAGVFALGTATWPVSSAQLWPHAPGQLLFAASLWAASSRRPVLSGIALAAEILVRPVAAVVPAVATIWAALERRWRLVAAVAAPAAVAVLGLVLYNDWAFGAPSLTGGYSTAFRDRATGQSVWGFVQNGAAMVASPHNGLVVWSPVILVTAVGLRRAWPVLPTWARQGLIGALAYLLVHVRLNRASGGLAFDYRYPLEALALAAPALVVGARVVASAGAAGRKVLVAAVVASLMLQGLVAFTLDCTEGTGSTVSCQLG